MGLSNAERQARWRAKRDAEIERLRNAAPVPEELAEARKGIAALRKQLAEARGGRAGTMTLDMISTKTGRQQAEVLMRQQAGRYEWDIRQRVQAEIAAWRERMLPEYNERLKEAFTGDQANTIRVSCPVD